MINLKNYQRSFIMQKKIIAVAIATVFSAPSFADNSNITVYGKLNADFESVRNDKATLATNATSLTRVVSNASYLGFKGGKDLGDDLQAIFQIEALVDLNSTSGNGFSGALRNSNVGLKGNLGTVFYGNWDTPYKVVHNKIELFDNTHAASALNITGRAPYTSTTGANFNTRQKNVVQYWTPDYSGFQAKLAYSPDNAEKGTLVAGGNKAVWSLGAIYENDLFYGAYGYEAHKDTLAAAGSTVSLTDTANRLVGAYKFKDGQIGLTYEHLSIAQAAASTQTVSRNGWELSGKYKFGDSNIGAFYSRANDLEGAANANTGANQFSLRYGYKFHKDTEVYGFYTELRNKTAGLYNLSAGNTITGAVGAKLSGLGLGIIHTF
ncbi:MAG: hypothetical protein A2Z94_04955 [Gallionellales bacterium GWA2_55_18]|nr:MAG: hypothetical protein A2Z94_04955 [Gallionellales bacterium GWA2_55_18]